MAERRPGDADDAVLVRAVAAGSEEALAALYDRHVAGIFRVAIRLANDRQLAEEVVQETFLALWNRAELFDPATASLATWLRTIARNRTVDRLRAAGRRPSLVSLGPPGADARGQDALDRLPGDGRLVGGAMPAPAPDEVVEARERRERLARVLDSMPAVERSVILLAYREELTQSEIATRLDWPLGTVKTRTRRALARLREALESDELAGREPPEPGTRRDRPTIPHRGENG